MRGARAGGRSGAPMAPRTRSRPRGRTRRSSRGQPLYKRFRADSNALAAAALAVASLVLVFIFVDVPAALANGRDWLIATFGVGLVVLAALSVAGGFAVSRALYEDRDRFARQAAGAIALGLFVWGIFGLNEAGWDFRGVDFREVSLGGRIGQGLVSGIAGKLAWLSLGIIAAAMLAPGATMALARNAPLWA